MKRLILLLTIISTAVYAASTRTVPADIFQVNVTGNSVQLEAPVVSSSYTLNLPSAQGAASTFLKNDGTGNLSWATPTSTLSIGENVSGGTPKSILFLDSGSNLAQDTVAPFVWNSSTHHLGIGTNAPALPLEIDTQATVPIFANMFGTGANGGNFRAGYARGTIGSPAAVQQNDIIGNFSMGAYDGTTFFGATSASMNGIASENWTSTAHGTHLQWRTTATGAVTNTIQMLLDPTGNLGVGTGGTYPLLSKFNVAGNATIGTYAPSTAAPANGMIVSGNVGIGTSSPATQLDVAGKFQVNSNGNVVLLNNVVQNWPSVQGAASTVLENDGSGNLSWAPGAGTVTSITAGTGLTGGTITTSGTIALATPVAIANGGTGTTSATGSGSLVLATSPTLVTPNLGTPSAVTLTNATGLPLTTGVTGTLPVGNGGTGDTSFTSNAVVIGNGSSQLAVVANNATATNKFLTQSSSAAPAWNVLVSGDIPNNAANTTGTASNVTGTVAIANGGTGQTTASAAFNALSPMTTAGDVIYGGTAGAGTRLAAGTSAQVLHSGTTPSWSAVSLTADVTGTLPIGNGGTGGATLGTARQNLGIGAGNNFLTSGTTFTTVSTITASTQFKFILVGGGGGGSGINTANRGATGGGAGASCIVYLTGLAPSTGYTMAIGAAGTAGAATPTAGGNGGTTSITINATTYSASGGVGGPTGSGVNGGTEGVCTNATIALGGADGGPSTTVNGLPSGAGGGTTYGFGGQANVTGTGIDGEGFGGGGGGAWGTAAAGGAGAPGAIIVEWWD